MKILEQQTSQSIGVQLTLLPEDSHVKTFPSSVAGGELPVINQDFGCICTELLKKSDLQLWSLKTLPSYSKRDLKKSYIRFSKAGMMRNGDVFEADQFGRPHKEKDYLSLPTPMASDGKVIMKHAASYQKYLTGPVYRTRRLIYFCHLNGLTAQETLRMYEWMMGFPLNWTRRLFEPSETL